MDLFVVLPSLLVVIALIAIFSGRSEPDPDQERPQAIYLSLVALVTLAVVLGSVFAVLGGLVGLTDKHSGSGYWSSYSSGCAYSFGSGDDSDTPPRLEEGDDCEYHEDRGKANHDDDVRAIVYGLIVLAVAGGVRRFHMGALRSLNDRSSGPGRRVYQRYLYAACFLTVSLAIGTGTYALTRIPSLVSTDTFGVSDHGEVLRSLALFGVFAVITMASFRGHWYRRTGATPAYIPPPPPVAPPPPPVPEPPTPPGPPVRKAPAAKKTTAKKAAPRK